MNSDRLLMTLLRVTGLKSHTVCAQLGKDKDKYSMTPLVHNPSGKGMWLLNQLHVIYLQIIHIVYRSKLLMGFTLSR